MDTVLPLQFPPGLYRNGTDMEAAGRWRDGSLVRWREGKMQPVGGWEQRTASQSNAAVRGMAAWRANNGNRWIGLGTYNKLYALEPDGTLSDITPVGLTAGTEDQGVNLGYGGANYGDGFYGTPRQDIGTYDEATTWALDTWGEYLVACSYDDGDLYEWTLNTGTPAATISNAPTSNLSLIVTPERFLVALGAGGNPRKVQWSDREDNTTWTAAATNEAGDFELQTPGQIMCGERTRAETLILTDRDAWAIQYVGPPFVYGREQVGTACGVISRGGSASTRGGVFWMGNEGFYQYSGGGVTPVSCDVLDYVFANLNRDQQSKVWAVSNEQFHEVWWFYPQGTECDSYVYFNYLDGHWGFGSIDRTCGVDRGVMRDPIWTSSDGTIYDHEIGNNYGGDSVYAESGPISMGVGANVYAANELIPDEETQGEVTMTFKTRFHPNDTEREYGPYTLGNPTSVRFTGRQVRARVDGVALDDWRVGIPRLRVAEMGRR